MTEHSSAISKPRVYLAAPLFSSSELMFNKQLKESLNSLFDIYLPQEDGCLLVELISQGIPVEIAAKQIFAKDLKAIKECDLFIIVLDGRTVDEGAAFELGFAFSLGKECVGGIQTDVRRLLPIGNNPMISCAISHVFTTINDLFNWANKCSKRGLS